MPKTKKQSKARKVLNWLNPTSPAKGALLFVIAFAVIGGGYMAFKSFAATAAYTYTDTSSTLVPFTNSANPKPTTIIDSVKLDGKNNTKAFDLKSAGQGVGMYDSTSAYQINTIVRPRYTTDRVCAVLRLPNGGSANIELQTLNGTIKFVVANGTSYHDACTAFTTWESISRTAKGIPGILFDSGSPVYVYSVRLEAN